MKELNVEQMAQVQGGCLGAADMLRYDLIDLLTAFEWNGSWWLDGEEIC